MLTKDQLIKIIAPEKAKLNLDDLCTAINQEFNNPSNNLNTVKRKAAFLSQCAYESDYFCSVSENLNYSSEYLMKTFGKHFTSVEQADLYAHQPEKIANKVYANLYGNGNEASGDGYRYRGRGLIQLTFKENYAKCGVSIDHNLVSDPDYLLTPKGALASAVWFYNRNKLWELADQDNIVEVTKKVNGGTNGLHDRIELYNKAKGILGA